MRLPLLTIFSSLTCFGVGAAIGLNRVAETPEIATLPQQPSPVPAVESKSGSATKSVSELQALLETPVTSMAEVNAASPQERLWKMAAFIQTASAEELGAYVKAAGKSTNQTMLTLAWTRWLELDPKQALASDTTGLAWWCYAKVNPDVALAAAEKTGDRPLSWAVYAICQSDPVRGEALIGKYPKLQDKRHLEAVVEGYARTDAKKAARFALDNGLSLSRPLDALLGSDPRAALAWAATLESDGQRRIFLDQAAGKLVRLDPQLAAEVALEMKPGDNRTRRIADAIAALTGRDAAAAREFLSRVPSGVERDFAGVSIAGRLAGTDAAAARAEAETIDWTRLSQFFENRETTDPLWGALKSGLTDLVGTLPEDTAAKVFSKPEENALAASLLMRQWAALAPEQASAWLDALPTGPQKDIGISGLQRWLTLESAEPDFTSALQWTQAATEQHRASLYGPLFARWYSSSPEQAVEALSTLPVTPDAREDIERAMGVEQH